MGNRSKLSIQREKTRTSPEMAKFKQQIIDFLAVTNATDETSYFLTSDLSKMTSMPFYKAAKIGKKPNHIVESNIIVKNYIMLFAKYYSLNKDVEFISKLFSWLKRNQSQYLRKLSKKTAFQKSREKKYGSANGIWEHPVPVNYTKEFLISCIISGDMDKAYSYIDRIYNFGHQVFLTKEENDAVCTKYNDTMPDNWDWETGDIFARYREFLDENIFLN